MGKLRNKIPSSVFMFKVIRVNQLSGKPQNSEEFKKHFSHSGMPSLPHTVRKNLILEGRDESGPVVCIGIDSRDAPDL
jgi:hypothetical protein